MLSIQAVADPSAFHVSESIILLGSAAASVGLPWAFATRRRASELSSVDYKKREAATQVVLDVRTGEQRARQGLPQPAPGTLVLHAPWLKQTVGGYCKKNPRFADDVMFAAHSVPAGTPLIIMDMEGEVSMQAATAVAQLGTHCHVERLQGGFQAWQQSGLPYTVDPTVPKLDDPEDLLCELEDEPAREPIFRPKLVDVLAGGYSAADLKQDVLSGVVVGVIALSLSMALGIASESTPAIGVVTAVVSGFIISAMGGSRVCVGGPTAAFIPILVGVAHEYGSENLVVCTALAGAMLVGMGVLGLGATIKFIPKPVVTGFTAGIATYIFSTQIKDFLGLGTPGALPEGTVVPSEFLEKVHFFTEHLDHTHMPSLALAATCLGITLAWPKAWAKVAPPQIVAVIAGTVGLIAADQLLGGGSAAGVADASTALTAVSSAGPFGIETIGSHYGVNAIPTSLPMPSIPAGLTDLTVLGGLVHPALSISLLAAIESLLCARVADSMIGDKHNPNTELIAQGAANIASAAFGGLPATGALARTAANVRAGGRSPIAGMVHASTILAIMMTAGPAAAYIPLPALSAVLVVVALNMGEWRHFRQLPSWPEKDAQLYLLAFFLTVLQDVTVAVELGMLAAVALYVRDVTGTLQVQTHEEGDVVGDGSPGKHRSSTPLNARAGSPSPSPRHRPYFVWEQASGDSDLEGEDYMTNGGPLTTAGGGALQIPPDVGYLDITGSLLFGGGLQLEQAVHTLLHSRDRPHVLVVGLSHVSTIDVSGLEVLEDTLRTLKKANVSLVICGACAQPLQMLARAGFLAQVGADNVCRSLPDALARAGAQADRAEAIAGMARAAAADSQTTALATVPTPVSTALALPLPLLGGLGAPLRPLRATGPADPHFRNPS